MSETKTKIYVVVKSGINHKGKELEIGSEIELTDGQAMSRVNKVVLKTEFTKGAEVDSVVVSKLKTKVEKSEETVSELTTKLETSEAKITELSELVEGDIVAEVTLLKAKIELYESFKKEIGELFDDPDIAKSIKALDKAVKAVK